MLLWPAMAHAECSSHDVTVAAIANASLTIPADQIPIGVQLSSWGNELADRNIFNMNGLVGASGCIAQGNWFGINLGYADSVGAPASAFFTEPTNGKHYQVYQTSVPGIGYIVGIRDYRATDLSNEIPLNVGTNQTYPTPALSGINLTLGYRIRVLLVATGRLKSGSYTIPPTVVATLRAGNSDGYYVPPPVSVTLATTPITINARSCVISAPADQVIEMPDVAIGTSNLTQIEKYFEVGVSCDAGVALYATLTDMSNPSNTSTVLYPDASSVAQGVGIQLFKKYESVPVAYGPDSSAAGNPNQWFVAGNAGTPGTAYVIPFSAKYVILPEHQVGATGFKGIKPGYFEAAASITFSYQ